MSLIITSDPVPLEADDFGVIRVRGTRVTLDTIATAYLQGCTAEEIAEQYPVVALPDIHAVISFFLRRKEDVEAYLKERKEQRDEVRHESEARFPSNGIRERLLARRTSRE